MNELVQLNPLLTPKVAAQTLGISVVTLTRHANAKRIRCSMTAGGRRRYPLDAIRAAHEGRWEDAGYANCEAESA